MQVKLAVGRTAQQKGNMAHIHDLEWEVGSRRIICMYDSCEFVMDAKEIIALVGNHAAQQSVHPTDGILRAQQQLSPTKSGTAHDPNLGKPISG